MNREEIQKILELLEKGIITKEEALELIEALKKEEPRASEEARKGREDLDSLVEKLVESAKRMGKKGQDLFDRIFDNLEIPDFGESNLKVKKTEEEILEELKDLNHLKVKINNGNLKIKPSKDENFNLQAEVYYSDSFDEDLEFYDWSFEEGCLTIHHLLEDREFLRNHINFILEIPTSLKELEMESVNSSLFVSDIHLEDLNLKSVNGRLGIYESVMNNLTAETVNGTLILEGLKAEKIVGKSINGDVTANELTVSDYNLVSLHGQVKLKKVNKK